MFHLGFPSATYNHIQRLIEMIEAADGGAKDCVRIMSSGHTLGFVCFEYGVEKNL
jgi:hypothetical protein